MNRALRKRSQCLSCLDRVQLPPAIETSRGFIYKIYFANGKRLLPSMKARYEALELLNSRTVASDFTEAPLFLPTIARCATCGSNDKGLTASRLPLCIRAIGNRR